MRAITNLPWDTGLVQMAAVRPAFAGAAPLASRTSAFSGAALTKTAAKALRVAARKSGMTTQAKVR